MATPQSDGSIVLTTKVVTTGIQKGMTVIKNSIKTATVALTAFGTATAYLTKQSVQAYAEYEQLVGGVETLFKNSSKKVIEYAQLAYKTTGQSAIEYMQNVTSFSASLLSAVGGDTEKAADVANAAMISISDNVNKMGSSAESVQMAFQGFAKQQYVLLDNLKLGYGGTKTEMERLLMDAESITGVKYDISNLADVYTAIGVIQENLGIAGTTAKEAATTISGSAATMKAALQNVLTAISGGGDIDTAIENLVDSVEIYFKNIVPVVERALMGIGTVIERIAPMLIQTVASAFIKALPQLISAVWQMIQGMFQGVKLALIELLSGKPNEIIEEQAEKTKETAKNQAQLTENIKETNKEMKKTLAGFDDIQILSASVAEDSDGGLDAALQGVGGSLSSGTEAEFDGSPIVQEVSETFAEIAGKVSGWLMALGCVLLVTGNIGWGIGLIIAGAIGSEYAEAQVGDGSSLKELIDTITNALIIAGVVAIILGILLCMAQMWGLGIKLIAMGAITVGGSVALNWDSIKEKLQSSFGGWLVLGGIIAIVLGILLCFTPFLPLGIGLIVLGAGAVVAPIAANWNAIIEALQGPIGIITAIVSGSLLVLGIILVCAGVLPIGIGLIAAGAIGLAPVVAINLDAIIEALQGSIGKITAIVSGALLVLGIILVCTGVGIPLGIGLILAGAAGLATVASVNRNAIVDWVKGAWDAVKEFWNRYIAPVFTAKFWLDLAKKCGNGLINGFESAINGIIGMFEKMINWIVDGLNKISFDVPDWVPLIGGKTFGFNIPRANFGRLSIPRLAQGAVIPPNREFLAVLGDQKHGTNIEAPLQTIVDAFNIALAQNGGAIGGNTEVVLEIDGREFGRAVVEQGNRENRRIGTRLVIM